MKRKIVGIIFCTLVIATSIPIVSGTEQKLQILSPGMIDQQQPHTPEIYFLEGGVPHWQQIKNQGNIMEKVDLHIGCYFSGSYPITLSIEEIFGTSLTQVTYQATALPDNHQDWFTFDFPNVQLDTNKIYFIVLRFDPGSEYCWSGSHDDPYPLGGSSHPDADWDFAFKTIVDKPLPKNKQIQTPGIINQQKPNTPEIYCLKASVQNFLNWQEVYFDFPTTVEEKGFWYHPATIAAQQKNCDPCFLLHPDTSLKWTVDCEFQVNTTSDDDFIGFTFGYHNLSHFCTIDWVANYSHNRSYDGFTIREFNSPNSSLLWMGDFEDYKNTPRMTILNKLHEKPGYNNLSWKPFIWYKFHLNYNKGSYDISISENGQVLWSIRGAIKNYSNIPCRFGFYACSLKATEFHNAYITPVIKGLSNDKKVECNSVQILERFPNMFPILRHLMGL